MFVSIISIIFVQKITDMQTIEQIRKPSKIEQRIALKSYEELASAIQQVRSKEPEIEIEETNDKIKIPFRALQLLGDILKAMSEGKPISIVPVATEITTQKAAEMLGCSRPHLVKLLENGEIEYTKVGKHRRIMLEDIITYRHKMKEQQKKHLIDIMNFDEEAGLYDS